MKARNRKLVTSDKANKEREISGDSQAARLATKSMLEVTSMHHQTSSQTCNN